MPYLNTTDPHNGVLRPAPDPPLPLVLSARRHGPLASKDAAKRMKPYALTLQADAHGLTSEEITDRLSARLVSIRPRVGNLVLDCRGHIGGCRRPTSGGCSAIVIVWHFPEHQL